MLFPPELLKSVAFIGYKTADQSTFLAGTVFFVAKPIASIPGRFFPYAITAKHVIDGIRDKGLSTVMLRLNKKDGAAVWFETSADGWLSDPSDPLIDLACIGLELDVSWDHLYTPIASVVTKEVVEAIKIGTGDEVHVAGLFAHHFGRKNNIPIVRTGNIAAMPQEKVSTRIGDIDAYLIEARSIGGLSGSPVYVNIGGFRNGVVRAPQLALLGVMHGHFDAAPTLSDIADDATGKSSVNVGVGIVVPAEKLLGLLRHPAFIAAEAGVERRILSQFHPVMDGTERMAGRQPISAISSRSDQI